MSNLDYFFFRNCDIYKMIKITTDLRRRCRGHSQSYIRISIFRKFEVCFFSDESTTKEVEEK